MDTAWHYAPDSKKVPPQGDGATVLNPMSKKIASDPSGPFGVLWAPLRVLLYPLGSFGGSFWGPLESFGILWGCFGDPLGSFGVKGTLYKAYPMD